MSNQVIKIENKEIVPASLTMLQAAIESNVEPEKLLQFYKIHEMYEANEARKSYAKAMVKTQHEIPIIPKNARNPQTNSMYSSHDKILEIIIPIYTANGLSLTFSEGKADKEGYIRTVCEVFHESGHIREYFNDLPLDNAGIKGSVNKTDMHATGSTKTYGRRYLTLMIFNIATGDDSDGNLSIEYSNKAKAESIKSAVNKHSDTINAICLAIAEGDYYKANEAFDELTNDDRSNIRIAPTKAIELGIDAPFTTNELDVMKSSEWAVERRKFFKEKNDA